MKIMPSKERLKRFESWKFQRMQMYFRFHVLSKVRIRDDGKLKMKCRIYTHGNEDFERLS